MNAILENNRKIEQAIVFLAILSTDNVFLQKSCQRYFFNNGSRAMRQFDWHFDGAPCSPLERMYRSIENALFDKTFAFLPSDTF